AGGSVQAEPRPCPNAAILCKRPSEAATALDFHGAERKVSLGARNTSLLRRRDSDRLHLFEQGRCQHPDSREFAPRRRSAGSVKPSPGRRRPPHPSSPPPAQTQERVVSTARPR